MGSTFAGVTALTATAAAGATPATYDVDISADWTIAGKPNGGYLLALLGRAAAETGAHPHVVAASATYVAAPSPGAAVVEAEVLRGGRSASQLRVRMLQDGRACVESLITTSELSGDDEPYWTRGLDAPPTAPFDRCLRVPSVSPVGLPVPIMGQVDLRIDPADSGFSRGEPSGRGELRGWLALADDEPFDPVSLLYAVDAFPPATFEVEPTGWVPTLELTAYVRALPAPGAVQVHHRAQLVQGGRADEVCSVWDAGGRLVAQATQLAGIRVGGRPAHASPGLGSRGTGHMSR